MPRRTAKLLQSDAKRLFKAASEAGVNVRVEFRSDGTIVATTCSRGAIAAIAERANDLDEWMKTHHANPA
jgi:phosphopantetheine adenylyltransferase